MQQILPAEVQYSDMCLRRRCETRTRKSIYNSAIMLIYYARIIWNGSVNSYIKRRDSMFWFRQEDCNETIQLSTLLIMLYH